MDPTTSAHMNNNNPFVSSSAGVLHSELAIPKDDLITASSAGPGSINASTAGVGNIAPLTADTGAGSGQTYSSGYSGLGDIKHQSQNQGYTAKEIGQDTTASARDTAQDVSNRVGSTAQDASNRAGNTTQDLSNRAGNTAQDLSNRAGATAQDVSNRANNAASNAADSARNLSNKASATASDAATGIRQRVKRLSVSLDNAADHPAVKNARGVAERNVSQLREQLGRSKTIRELEARTGVDRVALVVGGAFAYLLLIPLNLFGLALPITNILTILPAAYLAAEILDSSKADASDDRVKQLLAYFVVFGLIQTTESLAAGVMERRIPQYYTVKLLALAYMLHPRTNGAMQVHENVFRPIVQRASAGSKYPSSSSSASGRNDIYNTASTPPTSKPAQSTVTSPNPTSAPSSQTSGYAFADPSAPAAQSVGTIPVVVQVPLTADMAQGLMAQEQQRY